MVLTLSKKQSDFLRYHLLIILSLFIGCTRPAHKTLEVELLKKKDRGLGLSIVGKKSGPGVFISEVVKGIKIGTQLISFLF